jgi:hypothetical protein
MSPDDRAPVSDAPALRVLSGETVLLSPESDRFKEFYRSTQPRSAQQLRKMIGLSDAGAEAARAAGVCCQPGDQPDAFPPPEDLSSDDEVVRGRAFDVVGRALQTYVRTPTPQQLVPMEASIERFFELTGFIVNLVALQDIYVADGAVLTVSENTHVLEANKVVIEGTGRIDCSGYMKLNVYSIEGA